MTKYYYHKRNIYKFRLALRAVGLCLFLVGIIGLFYVFFPLLSWEIYLQPAFAAEDVASPIPSKAILSSVSLTSLIQNSVQGLQSPDLSDAANWYPNYIQNTKQTTESNHIFFLTVPKLGIYNATVSNLDNDLDQHLVNYAGTAFPPEKGNSVIFGHSTIPSWFDPHNYKAIFATALNLQIGDNLIATVNGASYTYTIDRITVVDADDTSPLAQQYDDSYLTIITCTPPGTTWKRLIIHSHLAKLAQG